VDRHAHDQGPRANAKTGAPAVAGHFQADLQLTPRGALDFALKAALSKATIAGDLASASGWRRAWAP